MLKFAARVVSWVFHPLLMVTYMLVLLLLVNPYLFGVRNITEANSQYLLLRILMSSFVIPAIAALMLKLLGMVNSLEMESNEERYIPYIITGAFYTWLSINLFYNSDIPKIFSAAMIGATMALFIAFFINIFSKISAHAVGVGGLLAMTIIMVNTVSYDTFSLYFGNFGSAEVGVVLILLLIIVITGLVGTARLLLDAHDPGDIYGGYLVGFISQFIALRIVLLAI